MGIMVDSLLWEMQDLYHRPKEADFHNKAPGLVYRVDRES